MTEEIIYVNPIIDTREKTPWDFTSSKYVKGTSVQTLHTGDYTISGFESIFCIERKSSVSEFAGCVSQPRFKNELDRMLDFKYRYLVLEFNLQAVLDFPNNAGIPKWKLSQVKISPQYMMRFLSEIQVKYGIQTLFCGDRYNAQYCALNLMRRVCEEKRRIQAAN